MIGSCTAQALLITSMSICVSGSTWDLQQSLTVEECANNTVQQDMVTFRETAEERLGAKLTQAKLEEVGIPDTLEYLMKIRMKQCSQIWIKRSYLK